MADRTPLQLRVYDCPADQAQVVLDIIEEFDLLEITEEEGLDDSTLHLGLTYFNSQIPVGSTNTVSLQLREYAPDTSWHLWEDPKFEWMGDVHLFTPEYGLFVANSDASGEAIFTAPEIRKMLDACDDDREIMRRTTGEAHTEVFSNLYEEAQRTEKLSITPLT